MSEKALLKEIEKDQQKEIEKKLASIRQEGEKLREKDNKKTETRKNIFSSKSFPAEEVEKLKQKYEKPEPEIQPQPTEEEEINKIESKVSQVIEKPNYDYMETLSEKQRKKIFSVKKEETLPQLKPQKKFKYAVLSILFAIFGIWGVVNITTINSVSSQITEVSSQYELNLVNYLKNLYTLDATNSENMKNLFETIPEEEKAPITLEEKSNWFDRICNFLEGLFGG